MGAGWGYWIFSFVRGFVLNVCYSRWLCCRVSSGSASFYGSMQEWTAFSGQPAHASVSEQKALLHSSGLACLENSTLYGAAAKLFWEHWSECFKNFLCGHSMIFQCNQCVIKVQKAEEVAGRLRPELIKQWSKQGNPLARMFQQGDLSHSMENVGSRLKASDRCFLQLISLSELHMHGDGPWRFDHLLLTLLSSCCV